MGRSKRRQLQRIERDATRLCMAADRRGMTPEEYIRSKEAPAHQARAYNYLAQVMEQEIKDNADHEASNNPGDNEQSPADL